jgi:galactose mutarotase-like enzyme
MAVRLYTNDLKIDIAAKGAELQSVYNLKQQLEYLWGGDPAFWTKHSPVLFPFVGQLKNDTYFYMGKTYHSGRHGFARDKDFVTEHAEQTRATFLLVSNEETKKIYPFDFEFRIHYSIEAAVLTVIYDVLNTGGETMYFSVGGHPAFRVPLAANTVYSDYYLAFEHLETISRMALQNGLIGEPVPFLHYEKHLPLSYELFNNDAIVLKGLKSGKVLLKSDKTDHGLCFDFEGFPYLGIWAAKGADFVCIEPWHGIADSIHHNCELEEKEGIIKSEPGHRWQDSWQISCW